MPMPSDTPLMVILVHEHSGGGLYAVATHRDGVRGRGGTHMDAQAAVGDAVAELAHARRREDDTRRLG